MKIKHLLPLLVSIILILILVATSCTPAVGPTVTVTVTPKTTATTTTTATPTAVTKDKTYRALNPGGVFVPVETKSLAPRLDTFDGKTIWLCQTEADPVIMPALWDRLQKEYPKTTWKRTITSSTSPLRLTADELKTAQAIIVGVGW
jgi:hypothetical protein